MQFLVVVAVLVQCKGFSCYPLFHSRNKRFNKKTRTLQRFVVTLPSVSSPMLMVGLCTQNSDADHIWHYS